MSSRPPSLPIPITANAHVGPDDGERALQAHLRQRRELAADRGHVGGAEQVACGDAEQLAPLPPPEPTVVGAYRPSRHDDRYVVDGALAREVVGVAERIEQARVGDHRGRERARGARERDEAVAHERIVDELVGELRVRLDGPGEQHPGGPCVGGTLDRGGEVGGLAATWSRRACRQCRVS